MADMLFNFFLGDPDVKEADQQKHERQEGDHFQKELAEISVDLEARVKTKCQGADNKNGKQYCPEISF